jgi:hypothetical protein
LRRPAQAGGVTAVESLSAEALLTALGPYAKIRRFPGHLRVIDVHKPYLVDEPARLLVREALLPLLQNFLGPEDGARRQPSVDMFTILDRMLLVVGAERSDLRCWITYRMLAVRRRPTMWVQAIVTRPGLQATRIVPMVLGAWIIDEWVRHRCQPMDAVTMSRNAQFLRFSRTACGEDNLFPRADGVQPPDVRHVVEIIGSRMVYWLRHRTGVADASLDVDAQIVRNTFADGPRSALSDHLGPRDEYVMVARLSARSIARQLPRFPSMLRARRQAEARLGGARTTSPRQRQ